MNVVSGLVTEPIMKRVSGVTGALFPSSRTPNPFSKTTFPPPTTTTDAPGTPALTRPSSTKASNARRRWPSRAWAVLPWKDSFSIPFGFRLSRIVITWAVRRSAAARVPSRVVEKAADLVPALDAALAGGGTQLVVVRGDRAANLARHLALTEAVAAAVGG